MLISIILPTYNRGHFLAQAFSSLNNQTYKEWELIVVDDGSTDDTESTLLQLNQQFEFELTYIKQANGGPAKARNTGIKKARGTLLAFFDSDDTWESNHLSLAVETLQNHAQLDWVYFSCRRIEYDSKTLLLKSTFYNQDVRNALFSCATPLKDNVYQLDNKRAALCQLNEGIDSGLQNSVIRAKVFETILLPDFRIGEDRLFILQALKHPFTLGFVDEITVNYMVHDGNSSDTNVHEANNSKRIAAMQQLLASYEATADCVELDNKEKAALNLRLSEDYFWKLGYALQSQDNKHADALKSMWTGIGYYPYKAKYWKTLATTFVKWVVS